jgi:hypothetical protein
MRSRNLDRLGFGQVVTNDERFSAGLASVQAKLFTMPSAARADIPVSGKVSFGTSILNSSYGVRGGDNSSAFGAKTVDGMENLLHMLTGGYHDQQANPDRRHLVTLA